MRDGQGQEGGGRSRWQAAGGRGRWQEQEQRPQARS